MRLIPIFFFVIFKGFMPHQFGIFFSLYLEPSAATFSFQVAASFYILRGNKLSHLLFQPSQSVLQTNYLLDGFKQFWGLKKNIFSIFSPQFPLFRPFLLSSESYLLQQLLYVLYYVYIWKQVRHAILLLHIGQMVPIYNN